MTEGIREPRSFQICIFLYSYTERKHAFSSLQGFTQMLFLLLLFKFNIVIWLVMVVEVWRLSTSIKVVAPQGNIYVSPVQLCKCYLSKSRFSRNAGEKNVDCKYSFLL